MTQEIATPYDPALLEQGEFPYWSTTEQSISFLPACPEAKWIELTEALCNTFEKTERAHASLMFRIGDALRFGESQYGETYAAAVDLTHGRLKLSAKTLQNVAGICRNVPEENRHYCLTLSHYEAVQALPKEKQVEVLQLAEDEGDSVATLKNRVARARLTIEDKKLIATQTSQEPDELNASEIKRLLKRAKRGETSTPEPKAIIDLESDTGIFHCLDKASERLKSLDFGEMAVPTQKKWSGAIAELVEAFSPCRREKFAQMLANVVINYLRFAEAEKAAREWDADRKAEWAPILAELQKMYRRSMVSTHGNKGEE